MIGATHAIETLERTSHEISLHPDDLSAIVSLTQRGFGPGMTPEEVCAHVLPVNRLYLARSGKEIIGFASLEFQPEMPYFSGMVVDPESQCRGVAGSLTKALIQETIAHGKFWGRTQNPIIEYILRKTLAKLQEERKLKNWQLTRTIIPALYGRMLTERQPLSPNRELNEIYGRLNYTHGDTHRLDIKLAA